MIPILSEMTGKVVPFGEQAHTAAGIKLIGNLFLIAMTAGVVDALALSKCLGIDSQQVKNLFEVWNPAGMMIARLNKITSATFEQPTWELNMARKDAGLMMQQAEGTNTDLLVIPAIADTMDRLISEGFGRYDWTVIGKEAV